MDTLLIVGVFILGAGSGGLCVMIHQKSLRSAFKKELEDQIDKTLFESVRRKRRAEFQESDVSQTSERLPLQQQ
jgi:hypothetical protein